MSEIIPGEGARAFAKQLKESGDLIMADIKQREGYMPLDEKLRKMNAATGFYQAASQALLAAATETLNGTAVGVAASLNQIALQLSTIEAAPASK